MGPHNLVALVTVLALLTYFWTSFNVGSARGKYKVEAPATTGHPEFERHFRVQMNTLEWLPIFLAGMWLSAFYWGDRFAAALGALWIVGRVIYMVTYVANPKTRSLGFLIQTLSALVLLIAGGVGAARALMATGGI